MLFRRREELGQALVEFALVLPLLLLLILGIIEFSFVWNSRNTVQFASRDASMLAAEGGSILGTDCLVLQRIESDIVSPARAVRVEEVMIYWADKNGGQIGSFKNVYDRSGSTQAAWCRARSSAVRSRRRAATFSQGAGERTPESTRSGCRSPMSTSGSPPSPD